MSWFERLFGHSDDQEVTDPKTQWNIGNDQDVNDPNTQFDIGNRYFHGKEVKKDYSEALKWYGLPKQSCQS